MIVDEQSGYMVEKTDEYECFGWFGYAVRGDDGGWVAMTWGEGGYERLLDIMDEITEDDIITVGWPF